MKTEELELLHHKMEVAEFAMNEAIQRYWEIKIKLEMIELADE